MAVLSNVRPPPMAPTDFRKQPSLNGVSVG